MNFIEMPEISGLRSIVHAALVLTFFYLGFIRKWNGGPIITKDQNSEKIREVVTTWMRATAESDLETVSSLIAEDAVFLLPISRRCEDEKLLHPPSVRPFDKSVSKASRIFRRFMSLETSPFVGISFF